MDNEMKLPVCTTSFQKEFMHENQVSICQKIKQSINKPNRVYLVTCGKSEVLYCLKIKSNYTFPKFNKSILSHFQTFIPFEKSLQANKVEAIILEEYVGKSLKELILKDSSFINIDFITELALKLLKIFEALHKDGIVFANLRPSNILIKRYNKSEQFDVFLINFENLIHFQTLNEQKFKENNEVTKRRKNKFSSVRLVKNEKVDFGTDLESLFYVLLYCVKSKTYYDFCEKKILIEQMKLASYKSKLISTLTSPLYEFLLYLVTLPYKAAPSYKILHHVLESLSQLPKDDICHSPFTTNSNSYFSEPLKRGNLTQVLESSEEDYDEDENEKSKSLTPNALSGMNQKSTTCDFTSCTKITSKSSLKKNEIKVKRNEGANSKNIYLIDEDDFDDEKNDFSTPNDKKNNKYQRFFSNHYTKNQLKLNDEEIEDEMEDSTKTNFDLKKYYFPGKVLGSFNW